jgi:flagellin
MPQVVATNISSLNAQRNLDKTGGSLATSLQRLSSGLRINSAKDDAAGLQISNQLTSQIRGVSVGNRNASDGISFAQIAEGALDEIGNIYQRMRELAVQSANGTNSAAQRTALSGEYTQLLAEAGRIATSTDFGSTAVFSGNAITLQVGSENAADNQITFTMNTAASLTTGVTADITTSANAQAALGTLTTIIGTVDSARGTLGAVQNRLESTIANGASIVENASAARSRVRDADFAVETANLARTQILQQAGNSVLAQANSIPQGVLSLLQ